MADDALTLMAVHAHPDDEASSTGGTLARYSAEGATTVLVTCTNGELGDSPAGHKPGEGTHDEDEVVALRSSELEESCRILGITRLERLGFRDSGMMGWDSNNHPHAFWNAPVDAAAAALAALMAETRPDVVITYDDYGFYGHPDHIQAHRITVRALAMVDFDPKFYCPTIRRSRLPEFAERVRQAGMEPPEFDEEKFGSPDEAISATVDCRAYAASKMAALRAHASQTENIFFLRFDLDTFTEVFGTEEYVRLGPDGTPSADSPVSMPAGPGIETDLFAGLR